MNPPCMNLKCRSLLAILTWSISLLVCMFLPNVLRAQEAAPAGGKDSGPMMRILCVGSLSKDDEVILAAKAKEGAWIEHGSFKLRSSFITPWVKAVPGEMHLARRVADGLVSIGTFQLKQGVKRSIVILLPDKKGKKYLVDVVDPKKLGFRKGTSLVVNYSKTPAVVMLGSKRTDVKPGQRVAASAVAGKDGMYRMLAGYYGAEKEIIACYDRYVPENPDSRDFLLLFADPTTVLRVYNLSEFGPFD